ncbi:hypothetical protein E9228_002617 [Curtobacterium flaccumfaciens]|jgi:hypothetical protein|uniref:Uncharacterized protein n=1 Tax=Curtobacterium salicis TaxID=1779862 RepID=A0ABX0TDL6_9MICO|nr:hypothetical protein [Curtobacterium sp. WW7]NII41959.1 hypothetical protein [Curtobacterium sp. WW7]
MANATTSTVTQDDRFRAVQLLPAPATLLALAVGAGQGLEAGPLAVVAAVGVLATLASALLPAQLAHAGRPMPAPAESDRYREDRIRN